ncbi:unnamed protein product [Rotaria magnacalcarata]|uniref:Uncharacterized protein n=1 Tax=Rotaria magnacalcarata TaxID=392030 RepID=A0A819M6Z5_9BILA|nr:unnamed protein product [Rotaria magnacalcarata]CAF3975145.1 unnamed protein product [Rotaria magnacalcarata]
MSNSGFKYFSSEFPSMPRPQYLPTNHNNTMLTKLDDLLGKITEVNNHLSNIESKYSKFEQFMTEKQESDLVVKENLNLLSKQSVEFKKDLVHHSLLIEQHDILFIKLIIPMFEDLFGLIVSQNQDKKGNILDIDLKLKLERYLIQMKKAKERWKKVEILLQWADDLFLAQALPNSSTSLRSNRIIDYAFVRGFNIGIQVYNGQIVKESDLMCNIAADYYEEFFKASNIVRPHPYTDSPAIEYDNINEVIPEVKLDELINTVLAKKKKNL